MLIQCIKFRKAQSTAEYAILFAIVIAAATAMQTYIRRSLNAKMKDSADVVTAQPGTVGTYTLDTTLTQYEPDYTFRDVTTKTTNDSTNRQYNTAGHKMEDFQKTDRDSNTVATVIER